MRFIQKKNWPKQTGLFFNALPFRRIRRPGRKRSQIMERETAKRILEHPEFRRMARKKSVLGWGFSALVFVMYVVYIAFIGISPESFAVPVSEGGITTWGIYIGLFVIVFSFVITGIYVRKANGEFDRMTRRVIDEVMKGGRQ